MNFYFSRWFACIPLFVMIGPVVFLSFQGVISTDVMIASGVVGLMLGSLFAKEKTTYWNVVMKSLSDPTGILVFALFLIVGIYAEILTASNLAEGLIWLSSELNISASAYALFIYIICSILGVAMGTSVGIVIIMTPIFYPVAVAMGVPPGLAAGAILAGAATGDHMAPISDTTILSSSTQLYAHKAGSVPVSRVVRDRMKYVIPAFLISCLLYFIVGGLTNNPPVTGGGGLFEHTNPKSLIMLVPMAIVVVTAIFGRGIFEALTYGIIVALVTAPAFGLVPMEALFYLEGRIAKGILIEGATQNLEMVVMIILMMGAYGVLRASGIMETIVTQLEKTVSRDPRSTELTMLGFGLLLNFILVGLVARIVVIAGPVFDALGRRQNLHPSRRANILDAVANSFSYVVPWHVWPLFMIMTITPLLESYPYLSAPKPTDFILTAFYPTIIGLVMLIAILTGYGRKFETSNSNDEPPS